MQSNTKRILLNTLNAIITLFIAISSVFLVLGITLNCVYIQTHVRGWSMQPTLNMNVPYDDIDGDTVYINRYRDYQVNDIVVVSSNAENTRYVIKRLIGLEGDIIRIQQDVDKFALYVNEEILYTKPLDESCVEYYALYESFVSRHRGTNMIVTNGEGDECIKIGKNECFLMGDNWGETTDSLSYGTLNVSQIVGRVDIIIPYGESHIKGLIKGLWNILT